MANDWNQLTENGGEGGVHSTFTWLYTWWETYLKHPEPFEHTYELFVLIMESKNAMGIAPLMREKNTYNNTVCFLGEGVSDYADFLVEGERESFFAELIIYLRKRFSNCYIRLQQFPQESPNYAALCSVLKQFNIEYQDREIEICPYISINGKWERYYSGVSKEHRYDIRRQEKLLSRDGKLQYIRVKMVPQELLQKFVLVNQERQHSLDRPSLFDNPFKRDFVSTVTEKFNNEGIMEAAYLALDSKIIAYAYGFGYRNNYYYWNVSFLSEFRKRSPGKILVKKLLEDLYKDKYNEFDFVRGDEQYKFIWARQQRSNRSVEFKV